MNYSQYAVLALKQKFGDEYDVDVTLHNYNDEQLFRGMVIENLTQRQGDFREVMENCVATKTFLIENPDELDKIRDSRKLSKVDSLGRKTAKTRMKKVGSSDIAKWLDPDERVISHDTRFIRSTRFIFITRMILTASGESSPSTNKIAITIMVLLLKTI